MCLFLWWIIQLLQKKGEKEEKSQEAQRHCSQRTRINLITLGIPMEINFKIVFSTGSVASVRMKWMCIKRMPKMPLQLQCGELQPSVMQLLAWGTAHLSNCVQGISTAMRNSNCNFWSYDHIWYTYFCKWTFISLICSLWTKYSVSARGEPSSQNSSRYDSSCALPERKQF